MASNHQMNNYSVEENSFLKALQIPGGLAFSMVMKTVTELDIFGIMAKAGPGAQFSAAEIASNLQAKNPEAPVLLDQILRFLAGKSYLFCDVIVTDEDGHEKRLYSLAPLSQAFIKDDHRVSISNFLAVPLDKVFTDVWYHLKDTILEGGNAFERAHGMKIFEYLAVENRFNEVFNKGMDNHTSIVMKKILEVYNGFEGVKEIIDVGGGFGASLAFIVSKYPNINAVNYDLPHVIKDARAYKGVKQVAGNMFESIPKTETIFMKWILHDWSDEHCLKILKNCWNALPDTGKVIFIDTILPEYHESDDISLFRHLMNIGMMLSSPGGKERTRKEFEVLAKKTRFSALKLVCPVYDYWVMELYKT